MSEMKVTLRLDAIDTGLRQAVDGIADQVKKLSQVMMDSTTKSRQAEAAERDRAESMRRTSREMDAALGKINAYNAGLERLGVSARKTGDMMGGMRSALAAVGVATLVREVVQAADAYANMSARLKLASDSAQSFARAQRGVFQVAQDTGQQLQTVSDLYTRMASALRSAGAGQAELLQITRTVNQAMVVSGASGAEAAGAVRQLTQAFASGVLRGEEFNSINEQAPRIMQAIAASIGKTTGELRKMADAGELTVGVLRNALSGEQARKIGAEFAVLPDTIERSMQRVQNSATQFIGKLDASIGASRAVADALQWVATNADLAGKAIIAVGVAIGVSFAGRVVAQILAAGTAFLAATSAAREMGIAVASTSVAMQAATAAGRGFLAIIGGIPGLVIAAAAGVAYLATKSTEVSEEVDRLAARTAELEKRTLSLSDAYTLLATGIAPAEKSMLQVKEAQLAAYESTMRQVEAAERAGTATKEMGDAYLLAGQWADVLRGEVEKLRAAQSALDWAEFKAGLTDVAAYLRNAYDAAVNWRQGMERLVKGVTGDVAKQTAEMDKQAATLGKGKVALVEYEKQLAITKATTGQNAAAAEYLREQIEKEYAPLLRSAKAYDARSAAIKRSSASNKEAKRDLADLREQERLYQTELLKSEDAAIKARQAQDDYLASLRIEIRELGMTETQRARSNTMREAENLLRQQGIALGSDEAAMYLATVRGLVLEREAREKQVKQIEKQKDVAREWQQIWTNAGNSVADVIADALTGGVKSFKDFGRSMLDIAKNAVRDIIAQWIKLKIIQPIIASMMGTGGGGGGSGGNFWGTMLNAFMGTGSSGGGGGTGGTASGGGGVWGAVVGAGVQYATGSSTGGGGMGSNPFGSALTSIAGNYVQNYFFGSGATTLAGNTAAGGIDLAASSGYGLQANTAAGGVNLSASAGAAQPYGTMGAYGTAAAWGGGILGAYYGATQAGDGQFHNQAGAAVTYGALGMGVAGTAAGVAGGASLGAAAGGAYAAIGSASWIPIVGWILALVAAVDMVSGGKVFGTKWQADTVTSGIGVKDQNPYASIHVLDKKYGSARFFAGPGDALGRARWRGRDEEATPEMQAAAEAIFRTASRTMRTAAAQLQIEVPPLVEGYWESITKYTRKGNVKSTEEISTFFGKQYKETFEQFQKRLNAEQIIGAVESAGGAAHQVAEQWRRDADLLLDGASMLLAAQVDIVRGNALLNEKFSLADVAGLVTTNQGGEESLLQTYARLQQSTMIFEDALAILGQQLDLGRIEFVQFATDIAEAAGGVDASRQLWADYFGEFYGAQALLLRQRDAMQLDVGAQLQGIGLDPTASLEEFRAAFENALPKLTPAQIVQWLQAGQALGALSDISAQAGQATDLLTASLHTMGLALDMTAPQFEAFAAQIADAAGGLDEANALWSEFFQGFYTETETLSAQVALMRESVDDQLSGLGLDADISMSEFRRAFERALPTLKPDEIVRWLQAGNALARLGQASERLAAIDPARFGRVPSAFMQSMRQIIDSANAASRAAREHGASEGRLALIHMDATRRIAAAVAMLRSEAMDLISQLYGGRPGSLGETERRIQEIRDAEAAAAAQQQGIEGVNNAISDTLEAWRAGLESIQDFLDSMLLDTNITTLTPQQQMEEARRQYEAALAAAQGGDVNALNQLPGLADTFLNLARGFWSSGDQYQAIFEQIRQQLQGLPTRPPGGGGGTDTGGGGVYLYPSAELRDLYAIRDEQTAAAEAAQRQQLAIQLAQHLNDLAQAVNQPVLALMESMGVNLSELATDLGVNLDEITAASVQSLASMAGLLGISLTELTTGLGLELSDLAAGVTEMTTQLGIDLGNLTVESTRSLADLAMALGVDLSELAQSVGIDLGDLANSQSLLNDALEATIATLPAGQAAALTPLLAAIEAATTEADANAALDALNAAVNELAPEFRDQLAPYLLGVTPSNADPDVRELMEANGWLASMDATLGGIIGEAGGIRRAIDDLADALDVASYDVGTSYVQGNQLANIHNGEMVIDPATAQGLRRYGIQVQGGGAGDAAVTELRALRMQQAMEADALRAELASANRKLEALESTAARQNEELARANSRAAFGGR